MNGYDSLDDHQLLARVSDQEPNALDALYSRYGSAVYSLAMFMLKDTGLAEEATQDIFLNIWLKSGSFKPDRGQPKTWIMSVAHHRIIDVIRVPAQDHGDYGGRRFRGPGAYSGREPAHRRTGRTET